MLPGGDFERSTEGTSDADHRRTGAYAAWRVWGIGIICGFCGKPGFLHCDPNYGDEGETRLLAGWCRDRGGFGSSDRVSRDTKQGAGIVEGGEDGAGRVGIGNLQCQLKVVSWPAKA